MSEKIPANESTIGRLSRSCREGAASLSGLWRGLPAVVQWGLVSAGLSVVRAKVPGMIPDDITPNEILAGGAGAALLHQGEMWLKAKTAAKVP